MNTCVILSGAQRSRSRNAACAASEAGLSIPLGFREPFVSRGSALYGGAAGSLDYAFGFARDDRQHDLWDGLHFHE